MAAYMSLGHMSETTLLPSLQYIAHLLGRPNGTVYAL